MARIATLSLSFATLISMSAMQISQQTCGGHGECVCSLQMPTVTMEGDLPDCVGTVTATFSTEIGVQNKGGCCAAEGCPTLKCQYTLDIEGSSAAGESCTWRVRASDGTSDPVTGSLNFSSGHLYVECGSGDNFSVSVQTSTNPEVWQKVATVYVNCLNC